MTANHQRTLLPGLDDDAELMITIVSDNGVVKRRSGSASRRMFRIRPWLRPRVSHQ